MKHLLTLLMVLAYSANFLIAQTIVGTDPENKNVVLEEYTGIHCPNCPDGHARAQAIYDAHPDDVVLINIHEGPFAMPSGSEPDYRTPWGGAIAGQAGSSSIGWPSGSVNRHLFSGNNTAMGRGSWAGASNQILGQPSYLNVGLIATIVTSTRQLLVEVEVYYTGDSPQSTNFLNVAILQNNILGPQSGGGMGNNYNHKHMLRHLLTGQWGVEITETTEGSLYTGTFIYEIPEDYKDVNVILEDLDIVGFVSETHQEVINGNMADITIIESNEYDAAIYSAYVPQTACSNEFTPSILLKNYGTQNLTSLDFNYSANGEDAETYTWTGNLNQNETELIVLPTIEFLVSDFNEVSIACEMPNGVTDQLPQNDSYSATNPGSITFPTDCYFAIQTLGNPEDLTWNIVDQNDEVITEGGPYETGGVKLAQFSFPETGCFTLMVNDASGEGLSGGFYVITDLNTDVLWEGAPFTDMTIAGLAHDITISVPETSDIESVSVYPNPVNHMSNIEFTLNSNTNVKVAVFDMVGRNVMNLYEGEMNSGNQNIRMDATGLNKGVYFIRIQLNNEVYTQKISIQ